MSSAASAMDGSDKNTGWMPQEHGDLLDLPHLTDWLPDLAPIESTYRQQDRLPAGAVDRQPASPRKNKDDMRHIFVHDADRVLVKVSYFGDPSSVGAEVDPETGKLQFDPIWARRSGPRRWIYFHPSEVKAAIVTCGGLCPGLNDVIRQVVYTLEVYNVTDVIGIQYGFRGFVDDRLPPKKLSRKEVHDINSAGGSFLGVSRGAPDIRDIVHKLELWGINMLFVIGGNGSHAGADAIYKQCRERKLKVAVVGIPKTIDNDILLLDKTFGFDTAVEEAQRAINAAYVEASSAFNGIGVVKLMGRQSGFIAMHATLANGQVDCCLIPEVPFVMEGRHGILHYMQKRLEKNNNFVLVVAEGAGQDLLDNTGTTDPSGNPILGDIGKWLVARIKAYFKENNMFVDVKYIDPTYMIRARPPNSSDHILCSVLGQNAVHAAFAGFTDITIGMVNTHYCNLPIPEVIRSARMVDPNSNMWQRCVTSTGQPDFFGANPDGLESSSETSSTFGSSTHLSTLALDRKSSGVNPHNSPRPSPPTSPMRSPSNRSLFATLMRARASEEHMANS